MVMVAETFPALQDYHHSSTQMTSIAKEMQHLVPYIAWQHGRGSMESANLMDKLHTVNQWTNGMMQQHIYMELLFMRAKGCSQKLENKDLLVGVFLVGLKFSSVGVLPLLLVVTNMPLQIYLQSYGWILHHYSILLVNNFSLNSD